MILKNDKCLKLKKTLKLKKKKKERSKALWWKISETF